MAGRRERKATTLSSLSSLAQPSPFDEALSRPFLNEGKKKKWTENVKYRNSGQQQSSGGLLHQHVQHDALVPYEPPTAATAAAQSSASWCSSLSSTHDERSLQKQDTDTIMSLHHEHVDLEAALLQERHGEFVAINSSMSQINDIQKDLASLVHAQQGDINDIEEHALLTSEALERATEHVEKASGFQLAQHRQTVWTIVVGVVLVTTLMAIYYFIFRA
uniref:t-SNARE coiled-coil homology domain-containing protein n=1 Tax=Attheya septentrionalis TaxID=420275 RepID=A0A7S2XMM9_9STRA|mmetsp:Transcript_21415/g.38714  ORF Transcript_21415/g.38714 Transcript_21415/m.38714 type:complete len:219 (+) Transcript_21415:85-741(+)